MLFAQAQCTKRTFRKAQTKFKTYVQKSSNEVQNVRSEKFKRSSKSVRQIKKSRPVLHATRLATAGTVGSYVIGMRSNNVCICSYPHSAPISIVLHAVATYLSGRFKKGSFQLATQCESACGFIELIMKQQSQFPLQVILFGILASSETIHGTGATNNPILISEFIV